MADPKQETITYPFTAFNFSVEIQVPALSRTLCNAYFSECDGLDMNLEVKTIREGGNNGRQMRLAGAATFGQVTLKRGMTENFDLWDWFDAVLKAPAHQLRRDLRGSGEVVLLGADRTTRRVSFKLERCLPIKLKAPALNAKDGMVAIEELQIVYESLSRMTGR